MLLSYSMPIKRVSFYVAFSLTSFRLKRANDAPPRAATKKTYQAVAQDLRGMNWLNELMKRSHDHCRLLESPLKVALRAQNFAQKQKNAILSTDPTVSPSLTPITSDDFVNALRKHSDAFLAPNQNDMRDRVLESCESDQIFLGILLASIRNLSAETAAAEIESVKSARRNLRKFLKQPASAVVLFVAAQSSTLVTSSEPVRRERERRREKEKRREEHRRQREIRV